MIAKSKIMQRCYGVDLKLVEAGNRLSLRRGVRPFFSMVSRLGDGVFWYCLMLFLPLLFGSDALLVSLKMSLAGVIGLLIYKWIKLLTERARPFTVSSTIALGTAPLDQYSFPSGHTLHAVSFSLIAIHYYPMLGWLLIPMAFLIALSRVVLGLHYPTDVLAGAVIGTTLATTMVLLWS